MIYKEIIDDLFNYKNNHYLVQCVSSDFWNPYSMGAGIVVLFNRIYNMKNKIQEYGKTKKVSVGDIVVIDNVFNLITKKMVYDKPTYDTITSSIRKMKEYAVRNTITKIALPAIGCGIDGLQWNKVSNILKKEFSDTNISLLICFLNQREYDKFHS